MAIHLENSTKRIVNPIYIGDDGKPASIMVLPGKLTDEKISKHNEITESLLKKIEASPENRIFFEGIEPVLRVHGASIKFPAKTKAA